jgi:hypothetical protein
MNAKLLALLAATIGLWANDTAATLGAGGLVAVRAAGIAMESEDLAISLDRVHIRYRFRNTTARDIETIVAFPLPPLNGGDVANIPIHLPKAAALNFVDFRVSANGRSVEPKVEVRGYFENVEITTDLARLKIPAGVLDSGITAAVNRLSSADRAKVTGQNWVDCKLTGDGRCWPYWQSRVQYYWTQRFPANATVELEQSYRPVVGGGVITMTGDPAPIVKAYCGDATTIARVDALRKRHRSPDPDHSPLEEKRIHYILTTANNWKGPIGSFHLTVETGSAEDILITCMPGLRQVAPTRYEVVKANFRPERDLELQIVQPVRR